MADRPPEPAPVPPKKRGGCGRILAFGCLTIIVLLVVVFGGGYLAYRSGALRQEIMMKMIGQGSPQVEVDNFSDQAVHVDFETVTNGKRGTTGPTLALNPFDVRLQTLNGPNHWDITFTTNRLQSLGTCHATLGSAERFQFVVLPGRIAVNRPDDPSSVGTDFVLGTSSLCK